MNKFLLTIAFGMQKIAKVELKILDWYSNYLWKVRWNLRTMIDEIDEYRE